jgi:hypothetical protein
MFVTEPINPSRTSEYILNVKCPVGSIYSSNSSSKLQYPCSVKSLLFIESQHFLRAQNTFLTEQQCHSAKHGSNRRHLMKSGTCLSWQWSAQRQGMGRWEREATSQPRGLNADSSVQVTKDRHNCINNLNAKLNPNCHLLALWGALHILHASRIRVKMGDHENSKFQTTSFTNLRVYSVFGYKL